MEPHPTTLTMPTIPAGRPGLGVWTLAGRYRMGEVIGRGGMSTVYQATDLTLGRDVAVKVLLAALAQSDPAHVARFAREARAVAALQHPAVVKVYDTGSDGSTHFIVMERVTGQSLDHVLRQERPVDPDEATRIAGQVAGALAAAHAAGILHRDIKPANVMVAPDGQVKVLDFGIARAREDPTLTQPAFALGTAAYMSPERVQGRPGDERSDIYSLGCLLYALLAGRPPFMGDDLLAVLHQQVHQEAVPPTSRGARIAPPLEALVLAMLAKDPGARPQTAAEVAARLADRGQVSAAAAAAAGAAAGARAAAGIPAGALRPPEPRRPSAPRRPALRGPDRRRLSLGGMACLAAVALALVLLTSGGGKSHLGFSWLTPTGSRADAVADSRAAHRATHTVTHPAVAQPATPASTPTSQPAATQPVPPGQGGVPPGQADGGPAGHKDKPKGPKPGKGPKGPKTPPGQQGGGD